MYSSIENISLFNINILFLLVSTKSVDTLSRQWIFRFIGHLIVWFVYRPCRIAVVCRLSTFRKNCLNSHIAYFSSKDIHIPLFVWFHVYRFHYLSNHWLVKRNSNGITTIMSLWMTIVPDLGLVGSWSFLVKHFHRINDSLWTEISWMFPLLMWDSRYVSNKWKLLTVFLPKTRIPYDSLPQHPHMGNPYRHSCVL